MSKENKEPIVVRDQNGKPIGWIHYEEWKIEQTLLKEMHDKWLDGAINGFTEPTEEEEYMQGISGVITKERGLVFQHDDGKLYEPEIEYPALKIPLTEIKEKLTIIRGATSFDF